MERDNTLGTQPETEIRENLERLLPSVLLRDLMRRTEKTILFDATWDCKQVVVKQLLNKDPFWRNQFRRELRAYRCFESHRPPFRVPHLIHGDDDHWVLVLEHLGGRPVASERRPPSSVNRNDLRVVVQTLKKIGDWRPPDGAFDRVYDYASRVQRYHAYGLLDDEDREALVASIEMLEGSGWQFCHGDPLLSNFIRLQRTCAVVDWEFAGFYLPGFDWACLYMLLQEDYQAKETVERVVAERGSEFRVGFVVNLAMAYTREIRIYSEEAPSAERDSQLDSLREGWADVRRILRS